jgi:hypothetical protein
MNLNIKKQKTWVYEFLVVLVVLVVVALITKKGIIEWIGVLAVLITFGHTQIADRLHEREARRYKIDKTAEVECYWKLNYYFYTKEILWFVYFVFLGAYSALVGVFLFLLYPLWRRWWRKRHPLK